MARVIIIGAGLAGSLLSIYLARRGFSVDVFEARPDMRKAEVAAGRSINLALSDRGIAALREVGMDEFMLAEAVPMNGRMVHSVSGDTKLLPYSGRKGEYINSVSRAGLNIALMNEAEKYPGVQFIFNQRCVGFNADVGEVVFENGRTMRGDTVIATDGAGSAIRHSIQKSISDFQISEVFLEHGYKELHIPPGPNGEFLLEKNALHIWPRHKFMMIALPNFDGSFTCTLFLAKQSRDPSRSEGALPTAGSEPSFDQLIDENKVRSFYEQEFPDALPLMPTLVQDFFHNPTGSLGTMKCWPWDIDGKALLLGDSAHAMVPFYGQGMNCAFEDVRVLDGLIDKHGGDWETIYNEYGQLRKENTDAIQDMAEENFYEMRDATADPIFQRKRVLETKLEQTYPDYFSKYSMVTFREDLPYAVAKQKGNAQDEFLMNICRDIDDTAELNLDEVMTKIRHLD
jgi:kynurenine 3-monooxygenase